MCVCVAVVHTNTYALMKLEAIIYFKTTKKEKLLVILKLHVCFQTLKLLSISCDELHMFVECVRYDNYTANRNFICILAFDDKKKTLNI